MSAEVIDGRAVAARIRERVSAVAREIATHGGIPKLATVLVGEHPASLSYIKSKQRACRKTGVEGLDLRLPADTPQAQLLEQVAELNERQDVHGILVQSPLPDHLDEEAVVAAIDPSKDVDGFHPVNLGNLIRGNPGFVPCTPYGIYELLRESGRELRGARVTIVGRSLLVGRPLAALLMRRGVDATVTVCHSRTVDLERRTREAEIVVAAIGLPGFLTGEMFAPGATVIDVGINRIEDRQRERGYRLVGDVDYDSAHEVVGAITPVPGGVGPMTVAMLLLNTVQAACGKRTEDPLGFRGSLASGSGGG